MTQWFCRCLIHWFFDNDLEWSAGNCVDDDCLMNEITTSSGIGVTVEGTIDGCIAIGSANVSIFPDYAGTINVTPAIDQGIGKGETITATLNSQPELPANTVYTWTYNDMSISGTGLSVTFPANADVIDLAVSYIDPKWLFANCDRFIQY